MGGKREEELEFNTQRKNCQLRERRGGWASPLVRFSGMGANLFKRLLLIYIKVLNTIKLKATCSSIFAWKLHGQSSLAGYSPSG